jgi:hypothetical protein
LTLVGQKQIFSLERDPSASNQRQNLSAKLNSKPPSRDSKTFDDFLSAKSTSSSQDSSRAPAANKSPMNLSTLASQQRPSGTQPDRSAQIVANKPKPPTRASSNGAERPEQRSKKPVRPARQRPVKESRPERAPSRARTESARESAEPQKRTSSSRQSDGATGKASVERSDSTDSAQPTKLSRRELRKLKLALARHKNEIKNSPVVALITGKLERIAPESIPEIVTNSPFLAKAFSQGEIGAFMNEAQSLGKMLEQMGISPSITTAVEQAGVDLEQQVSAKQLFDVIGIDAAAVTSELKNLKTNVQMKQGLLPYMVRAARLHGAGETAEGQVRPTEDWDGHKKIGTQESLLIDQIANSVINPGAANPMAQGAQPSGRFQGASADGASPVGALAATADPQVDQASSPTVRGAETPAGELIGAASSAETSKIEETFLAVEAQKLTLAQDSAKQPNFRELPVEDFQASSTPQNASQPSLLNDVSKVKGIEDALTKDVLSGQGSGVMAKLVNEDPYLSMEAPGPQARQALFGNELERMSVEFNQGTLNKPTSAQQGIHSMMADQVPAEAAVMPELIEPPQVGAEIEAVVSATSMIDVKDRADLQTLRVQSDVASLNVDVAQPGEQAQGGDKRDSGQHKDSSFSGEKRQTKLDGALASLNSPVTESKFELITSKTSTKTPAVSQEQVDRILNKAEMLIKDGGGSIRVKLNEDGGPNIELAIKVRGENVDVKILAADEQLRMALNASAPKLKEHLENQNLNLDSFDVNQDESTRANQQDQKNSGFEKRHEDALASQQDRAGDQVSQNKKKGEVIRPNFWRPQATQPRHDGRIQIAV